MSSTTQELQIQVDRTTSARFRRPSLDLLDDTREKRVIYLEKCVPLNKHALKGKWKDAKRMFEEDNNLVRTAITGGWATPLHVAAGANNVDFAEGLIDFIQNDNDLELQDKNSNTAFFLVAGAVGNTKLAQKMLDKNDRLATIRGQLGLTPLHFAVIQGKTEMATFLYEKTINEFQQLDWDRLFLTSVNADMYDLALKMLDEPRLATALATARDRNEDTGLHLLARKKFTKYSIKHTKVLELIRRLWKLVVTTLESKREIREILHHPSPMIFDAVLIGNFEFLGELLTIYHDWVWERDYRGQTIIHYAVEQRHSRIFNLIHEIGSMKDLIVSIVDKDGNNLLHLAAKLAPPDQLNLVSGAAFQLMLEILWFKEVEKIMLPTNKEVLNSKYLTPSELFTRQHKNLLRQAQKWMKDTANSCMLVSTVISTGVFASTFSLPGGNDNNGKPNYLNKPFFMVFSMSNGIALISSATSTLVFLSILISRYAESDFYKVLPLKLIFGLSNLFVSITSMMIAFSSALFITYFHGMKVVPGLISVLAFLLILLFVFLQFSLWYDILYSIYYFRSLFRPNKAFALLGR